MAGASLLTLLDDIATILDDVAVMTKLAAKKTAGVLGDDLALNAQQVSGVKPDRELPVVWAVAKGSFINKAILVPAALLISAFAPWLVTPLMMLGGAYLCFEGLEKVLHKYLHDPAKDEAHHAELLEALSDESIDVVAREREKIKGAIRTDFILSAEIIVITLGTVATAALSRQVMVVTTIALLMTIGVYGFVAAIVKFDDLGLHMIEKPGNGVFARMQRALGRAILWGAPWFMKALTVVGTAAMFLVGGGILVHSIPALHHAVVAMLPVGWLGGLVEQLANAGVGIVAGAVVLLLVGIWKRLRPKRAAATTA